MVGGGRGSVESTLLVFVSGCRTELIPETTSLLKMSLCSEHCSVPEQWLLVFDLHLHGWAVSELSFQELSNEVTKWLIGLVLRDGN